MGANYRKGRTYTWLPNHLMDGVEQVSPRSFLSALAKAVAETREKHADHDFAIHHEGIRRGVQTASETRVRELNEDIPWVNTVIRPLAGHQVPIEKEAVKQIWDASGLFERLEAEEQRAVSTDEESPVLAGPRDANDANLLIDELIALGVMRPRADGRIDLPDVYRIAFNIGRKGGVPRASG